VPKLIDDGLSECVGPALFRAGEKIVAAEEPERAVQLHRAEPTRLARDVDDRERQAARAAIGPWLDRIARETGKRPEAPAKRGNGIKDRKSAMPRFRSGGFSP